MKRIASLLKLFSMFFFQYNLVEGQEKGQGMKVIVEAVRMETTVDKIEALGTLYANESVRLTSSVAETVTAIRFDDGQQVSRGDILLEMTSAEEQALLQEARFNVEEAGKQLQRVKALSKKGSAAQSLLDERQRDYNISQSQLNVIQSRLQDRLILAPFSGMVGLRNISVGALVMPGDLITTLNDNRQMKLDFSVPATYLATLEPGLAIVATSSAFGDKLFKGEVSSIDNQVDPVTRSISIRAILPNDDGMLKPGLLMSVTLYKNLRQSPTISEEALVPEGKNNFVMVAITKEGGTVAEKRLVKLGLRSGGQVEVLQGLAVGDQIVTHGAHKLRPGQAVVPQGFDQIIVTGAVPEKPANTKLAL
jgi:membrane fusion protein (multidrug efflux system)